jgi:endonuclease/exonuclease/phosphatase family metal-dependent hydrolase
VCAGVCRTPFEGNIFNTEDLKKLGFKYFKRTDELYLKTGSGWVAAGSAIFSKLPITASSKVMLGDSSYPEYLLSADVSFQNKPVRIFSTHFKSLHLFANPRDTGNRVSFYGDSNFAYKQTRFEKLKLFGQAHAKEALIAKEAIDKSPFPVIVGTDMNSVPASYPYHTMCANLQDAFKLNSWGLGTTMDSLPKTLRIDFLLVDKKLFITNYRKDEMHLSDHFPHFIDVKWKR